MTTQPEPKSQITKQPAVLKLVDGDPFFQRMSEVYDSLALRAYELFDGGGRHDGHDLEDWLRAESEMSHSTPVEVEEADNELIVRADMPGLLDKNIEVRVEPRRLIICGKREQSRQENKGRTLYNERKSDLVFRMLDLPEEVDPDHVTANLQDGRLEISLPKARPARKVPIAAKAA
ncbi:MAG: Hsp20 family protein [Terriglobales bacterium]